MIETLILGTLAVTAAALIGYFTGLAKADELFIKKFGWDILCWQGRKIDRYFVAAKHGDQTVVLAIGPNGIIDFDYNVEKDDKQR